ncbi:hypothetical protein C8J56DRAFT_931707 [Mycena floridula]|nr:hypothetical protein C8J56DRAFT_931707 [Mycena floridula]
MKNISQLLREAAGGSLIAVRRLCSVTKDESEVMQYLAILFRLLEVPPPLDETIWTVEALESRIPRLPLVLACISGIFQQMRQPQQIAFVEKHWDPLGIWLLFITEHILDPLLYHSTQPSRERTIYVDACGIVTNLGGTEKPITNLPGFVSVLTRLWLYGARHKVLSSALCVGAMWITQSMVPKISVPEFIDTMEAIPDSIKILIGEMLASTRAFNRLSNVESALGFLNLISIHPRSSGIDPTRLDTFRRQLDAHKWIPAICQTLGAFLKLRSDQPSRHFSIFRSCLIILTKCFRYQGALAIRQALRSSFLCHLTASFEVFHDRLCDPTEEEGYKDILGAVTNYSLHPIVLRELSRWYRQEKPWVQTGDNVTAVSQAWNTFVIKVTARVKYPKDWKTTPLRLCAASQCQASDKPFVKMKRCSGCLSLRFRPTYLYSEHIMVTHVNMYEHV